MTVLGGGGGVQPPSTAPCPKIVKRQTLIGGLSPFERGFNEFSGVKGIIVLEVFFAIFEVFKVFSLGPGSTVQRIHGFPPPQNPGQNPGQKSDQKPGQKSDQKMTENCLKNK